MMTRKGVRNLFRRRSSAAAAGRRHPKKVPDTFFLWLLLAVAPAGAVWTSDGSRVLVDGVPVVVRGLWYPLDARRDGQAVQPGALVAQALASRVNLLGLRVIEGPCLDEAAQVLDAAAGGDWRWRSSRGPGKATRPADCGPAGGPAALQVWCAAEPASAPPGCLALGVCGALDERPAGALPPPGAVSGGARASAGGPNRWPTGAWRGRSCWRSWRRRRRTGW